MKKLIYSLPFLGLLISCSTGFNIYLEDENYKMTDFEIKTEKNSFPPNLTFFYKPIHNEVVNVYVDNHQITDSLKKNNLNDSSYYFVTPKPKSNFKIIIDDKNYDIPISFLDKYRHVYLANYSIYLSKSPSFKGVQKFEYGKKIRIKNNK